VDNLNRRVRLVDARTGIITTVAGSGAGGYGGDGELATSAGIAPLAVAVDGLGNLFLADTANHRLRRVDVVTGRISTVGGTGIAGFSGDDWLVTLAQLNRPSGIAVDRSGVIYVADTDNHRVRRIAGNGIISTVAGTGEAGYSGDGLSGRQAKLSSPVGLALGWDNDLYIADRGNNRVRRVDGSGVITTVAGTGLALGDIRDGRPATETALNAPSGVAADRQGNFYVSVGAHGVVRRVDALTGTTSTVAGSVTGLVGDGGAATSALLANPSAVGVDGLGRVLIPTVGGQRVRRVEPSTGLISTVAGNGLWGYLGDSGPATEAGLNDVHGIAVGGDGDFYLADWGNNAVRKVDALSGVITRVATTSRPRGVALGAAGLVYVAASEDHQVRVVDPGTGVVTTLAGTGEAGAGGDGDLAVNAQLNQPYSVAVTTGGDVFIADQGNHRVRRVDGSTGVLTTFAGTGVAGYSGDNGPATEAALHAPWGLALGQDGNLFIADSGNHRVRVVDRATATMRTVAGVGAPGTGGDGGPALAALLDSPRGLCVDGVGDLYLTTPRGLVRRVEATTGTIWTVAGAVWPQRMGPQAQGRLADPRAVASLGPHTLVAGGESGTVQALRHAWLEPVAGRYLNHAPTADLARFQASSFGHVGGVAWDASRQTIYLSESTANRIHAVRVLDQDDADTWTITTLANAAGTAGHQDGPAVNARFRHPTGLHLHQQSGFLYVADTGNHVIRGVDLQGLAVSTLVGTIATRGISANGTPATRALLNGPEAVTRCGNGDVFIADTGNHRVRRLAAQTGMVTTVLGDGLPASSGQGAPAWTFPVNGPRGIGCDPFGNLYVTSTSEVRLVLADDEGVVDGTGEVQSVLGLPPRTTFPATVTWCLTGLVVVDGNRVRVTDSCTGMLVDITRTP
jgi:sugar lactone lactonase YvrE